MDIFQSQFIFSGCNFLSVLPSVLRTKSRHDNLNLRRCVCVWRHVVLLLHHRAVTYLFLRHLSFIFSLALSFFTFLHLPPPSCPFSFLSVIPPCFSFLRYSVLLLPLWPDSSSLVGVKKKEGLCDANRSNPGITINKTHTHTHLTEAVNKSGCWHHSGTTEQLLWGTELVIVGNQSWKDALSVYLFVGRVCLMKFRAQKGKEGVNKSSNSVWNPSFLGFGLWNTVNAFIPISVIHCTDSTTTAFLQRDEVQLWQKARF